MKSLHRHARSLAVTLFALVTLGARAQAQAPAAGAAPTLRVVAENRTAAQAAARGARRADSTVHAGDVVRYKLTFTNSADRAIRNVAIQNPVPAGLQYVAGSAKASRDDARAEYSIDGGHTWSPRPMETVVVDGARIERPVAPERYTAVRWTVGGAVAPTATVTAEFEARLVLAPAKSPSTSTAPSTPGTR
jgi:uncharacterized repeat protein (TIGR01451 family)